MVVKKVSSVAYCKRPQRVIILLRPMERGMDHHGSCSGGHNLNGILSLTILMLSTYSRVSDALILGHQLSYKLLGCEDAIVRVVGVNINSMAFGCSLKHCLSLESL